MGLGAQVHRLNKTITGMKLELISFQRKSWFIPVLARDLNDCMDDEQAFLKEIMEKMRELHTRCTHLFLLDEPIVYDGKRKWTCLITFILLPAMRMAGSLPRRLMKDSGYEGKRNL